MKAAMNFVVVGCKFHVTSTEITTELARASTDHFNELVFLTEVLCKKMQIHSTCGACHQFIFAVEDGFYCDCGCGPRCSTPYMCCNMCACSDIHEKHCALCCDDCDGKGYHQPEWVLKEKERIEIPLKKRRVQERVQKAPNLL
jgi:hypothetical protein